MTSKNEVPKEHTEGVRLSRWCKQEGIECWHWPQETYTPYHNIRNKNKAAGVRSGPSDYLVYISAEQSKDGAPKALFIELKRAKKSLSNVKDSQRDFLKMMNSVQGIVGKIAYGKDEAVLFINEYYKKSNIELTDEEKKKQVEEFTDWLHN